MGLTITELYEKYQQRKQAGDSSSPDELCQELGCPEQAAELSDVVSTIDRSDGGRPRTPAAPPPKSLVGGRYCVGGRIAGGGFGSVHRGYDTRLKRPVAIKFLDRDGHEGALKEAKVISGLRNHPGIVEVYDVGTEGGRPFIVLDLMKETLVDRRRRRPPTPQQIAGWVCRLAEALHHVYTRHGIIHRDIKPANILFDRRDQPRLTDFGLAEHVAELAKGAGRGAGTLLYMSPEQVAYKDLDNRSDIYSLGVVLYYLLCGKAPFAVKEPLALCEAIQKQAPVAPSKRTEGKVPPALERICLRCLKKDPNDRYPDGKALADDLRRFGRPGVPRGWLVGAIAAVLCVGVVAGAIGWLGGARTTPPPPDREQDAEARRPQDEDAREKTGNEEPAKAPRDDAQGEPAPWLGENGDERDERLDWLRKQAGFPGRPPEVPEVVADARHRLRGHTGPVRYVAFSDDGKKLATASEDRTVKVWDARGGKLLRTLPTSDGPVQTVAFSPDGKKVAWACDGSYTLAARVWDLEANKEEAAFRLSQKTTIPSIHSLAFSPDGKFLAAGGDGPVRVWDLRKKELRVSHDWQRTFPSHIDTVAFAPDGAALAAACQGGGGGTSATVTVIRVRVPGGEQDTPLVGGESEISAGHEEVRGVLRFSPDGKSLIRVTGAGSRGGFGGAAGQLVVWDLTNESGPEAHRLPVGRAYALSMPKGKPAQVAVAEGRSKYGGLDRGGLMGRETSVARGSTVKLWDVGGKRERNLTTDHKGKVFAVAFSPDGTVLATGGEDHSVRLWDVASIRAISGK